MHRLAPTSVLLALAAATATARAGDEPDVFTTTALTTDPGWRFGVHAIAVAHDLPGENETGYGTLGLEVEAISQARGWLGLVTRAGIDHGIWDSEPELCPPYLAPRHTMWNASAVGALRACGLGVACAELGLGLGGERDDLAPSPWRARVRATTRRGSTPAPRTAARRDRRRRR